MKYLLLAVLFFCLNGFGQSSDSTRKATCILTDSKHYPIDRAWINAFMKANENYIYMDMRSKPLEPCKHIYVAVEPAEVRSAWASTGNERKDIVCIKCFHQTKQQIVAAYIGGGSGGTSEFRPTGNQKQLRTDSLWRLGADGRVIFDTILSQPSFPLSSGSRIFYVDTAGVLQAKPQKKKKK